MTCTSYCQAFLVSSPKRFEFGELRFVAGVGDAAGAQAVAEREADVVLLEDFADVVEAFVEKILLVVVRHPLRQHRAAAADDAGDALRHHAADTGCRTPAWMVM